ncbi:glycerophosphodiester phosphodiesterase family protein [Bifidobacterium scaligerum]|nr:glycerophosphodiester phosphodiesterase family protein [Bifidobacterium scaligerum]
MSTTILGHAGAAHAAPSNTMEAFRLAIAEGADGTELDVQMTGDGQLVCIHDAQLDAMTDGHGFLRDKTYDYVSRLNFSIQMPGYMKPTRVPLLSEVLELFRNQPGFVVNIEIKSAEVIYPDIERRIVDLVHKYDMADRVWYSNFNHFSLLTLREYDPDAVIAPLYNEGLVEPWKYAETMHTDVIHPFYRNLTEGPGILEGLKKHSIRPVAWTVDDEDDIRWMIEHDVPAIITDRPAVARSIRDGSR